MNHIQNLINEEISYLAGNPERINHFLKVHSFAKLICESEKLDFETQNIIEIAAILHDIGVRMCVEKYHTTSGKYREIIGPPVAKEMLTKLNYDEKIINKVYFLVGHHHSFEKIESTEHQILVEAFLLVNIFEENMTKEQVIEIKENIFKTQSGTLLLSKMFLNNED